MQRSSSPWLSSSVTGALLLSAVIILRLISGSPPHFHKRASLTLHTSLQTCRFIGEAPVRASEEVKQEDALENKQVLASLVFLRPEQYRANCSRLLLLPLSFPDRRDSFCPRKIPPLSATDDPFPG